jgi:citrate synthase
MRGALTGGIGWLAHWKQMLDHGNGKIWRPRQVYVGEGLRDYVPIEERAEIHVSKHLDGVLELPHYQSKRRLQAKL